MPGTNEQRGQIGTLRAKQPDRDPYSSNDRLDSWKEIGRYFGKDERTVKRWEQERGLPVHRLPGPGRPGVYAYKTELAEWLEPPTSDTPLAAVPEPKAGSPAAQPSRRPVWIGVGVGSLLALLAGLVWALHPAPRGRHHRPASPQAEELYVKGLYFWNKRSPETLNQAVDYFTQAIVKDPAYAQAYTGLADCYNLLREYSLMPSDEAYRRAIEAAKRAIALDDSLAGAHRSLAFAEFWSTWNIPHAEGEFRRSLELDPNSAQTHHWYATFLTEMGRTREALAEMETAQKLEPSSTAILADKGFVLFHSGRIDESIALLRQVQKVEPAFLSTYNYLSDIYLSRHDAANYLKQSRAAAELTHDAVRLQLVEVGEIGLARFGERGMLEAMLAQMEKNAAAGKTTIYEVARFQAFLGRNAEALEYLRQSHARHEPNLISLHLDVAFQGLQREPAYRDLVSSIGLPQR